MNAIFVMESFGGADYWSCGRPSCGWAKLRGIIAVRRFKGLLV